MGAGPPLKIGERVTRITPVARAPMDALLTSLNLAVQQGIDPDFDNAVAVATFAYQDAEGRPQQVWTPLSSAHVEPYLRHWSAPQTGALVAVVLQAHFDHEREARVIDLLV